MSSPEEIVAVFNEDVCRKSKIVFSKYGLSPFYDYFDGFQIAGRYDGLGIDEIVCSEFTPRRKNASKIRQKR